MYENQTRKHSLFFIIRISAAYNFINLKYTYKEISKHM